MEICQNYEVWFVIGSQHLYGDETLRQVQRHAEAVFDGLNNVASLPLKLVLKPLVTSPDQILALVNQGSGGVMNKQPTVAVLGLGAMGHAFATNLRKTGLA
ncbi:hypothetical protein D8L93_08845, partial [Sodalis-like symbiont of Bactericera trigonica]